MLRKTALFLLALFVCLFGLQLLYQFGLEKNVNLKSTYIVNHHPDADALFLGPCEPLWMMDPAVFKTYTGKSAYNLSTVHANFAENEAMLRLYLMHNKAPEIIFLYVSTESVDGGFNVFNSYSFASYANLPWMKALIQEQDTAFSKVLDIPFMRFGFYNEYVSFNALQGLKHALSGKTTPYFPDGYVRPHGIAWDGLERFVQQYPSGKTFQWNASEIKHLRQIVQLAKHYHCQMVLYESPMLNEIKPYVLNREEIKQKITKFATENNLSYWVFDTLHMSDSRKYFFSILNTNDQGSAIFNRVFAQTYLKLNGYTDMLKTKQP
jgi:hypothetical protein